MTPRPHEDTHTPLWRAFWKPLVLAGILVLALDMVVGRSEVLAVLPKETRAALYNALASSGVSLLGFILTAATLYLTITAVPRFEFLREKRRFNEGADYFYRTIGVLGISTMFALVCMIGDVGSDARIWMVYTMFVLVVLSCWITFKCIHFMRNITRIAGVPSNIT